MKISRLIAESDPLTSVSHAIDFSVNVLIGISEATRHPSPDGLSIKHDLALAIEILKDAANEHRIGLLDL